MPDKKDNFYVSTVNGHWEVRREGAMHGQGEPFKTREAALERAIELAKGLPDGQVTVQNKDGSYQIEFRTRSAPTFPKD